MAYLPSLEKNPVLMNVFKTYPEGAKPLLECHEALMRGPSPLSAAERELIAAFVSARNGCAYCTGVHTATAEFMGMAEGLVAELMADIESAGVDDKLKPILRYVAKLTDAPASVTQADADAVFAAGWDEKALYDAVAACCLFNFMNRMVEGLGITADARYFAMAGERLGTDGYAGLLKLMGMA